MSEADDFAKAFKDTSDDIAKGGSGVGAVTIPVFTETPPATPPVAETPPVTPPVEAPPVETPPVTPPVETPPVTPPAAETPPATPPAAETPPVTPPAEVPPVTPPAVETPPATPPAATPNELVLAADNARLKAELAAKAATPPAAETPPVTPPVETPPVETPPVVIDYTPENKVVMDEFTKEWPDVAKAMKINADLQQQQLLSGVKALMDDFAKRIGEGLAPVVNTHLQSQEEAHFAAIHKAHADYDKVVDLIPDWIKKQPDYMQGPMTAVYEKGTADQLIDLVGRFKKDTGLVQPQTPSPTPQSTATPAAAVAPDGSKVAALTVVPTKGGGQVNAEPAPAETFESAFNKSVEEINKSIAKVG